MVLTNQIGALRVWESHALPFFIPGEGQPPKRIDCFARNNRTTRTGRKSRRRRREEPTVKTATLQPAAKKQQHQAKSKKRKPGLSSTPPSNMKLSILSLLILPAASAFVTQNHARKPAFLGLKDDAIQDERQTQTGPADSKEAIDQRISEQFESDENSPAKIDAASKGAEPAEKPDRIFDPTNLWTPHSQNF